MMKAFYITGIVLSVIFMFVIGYFIDEVESARYSSYYYNSYSNPYDTYSSYSSYNYNSYDSGADETMAAAIVSFFFFVFFILTSIFGLIKVKTTTNKVLSIIGLSISGIFFFWNFLVMFSPSSISFDEVGGGWGFYSLIMLAFMIVGLVQAIRYAKRSKGRSQTPSTDILDS